MNQNKASARRESNGSQKPPQATTRPQPSAARRAQPARDLSIHALWLYTRLYREALRLGDLDQVTTDLEALLDLTRDVPALSAETAALETFLTSKQRLADLITAMDARSEILGTLPR